LHPPLSLACASVSHPTAPHARSPLSLHDALPISRPARGRRPVRHPVAPRARRARPLAPAKRSTPRRRGSAAECSIVRLRQGVLRDRKSTRLNSSHQIISYAVFCLKKKKESDQKTT